MANIECRGFSQGEKKILKPKIDAVLQSLGLGKESITDFFYDDPQSCDGQETSKPYLRVCSDTMAEILLIIDAFKAAKIGLDCEMLVLNGFISAEKMGAVKPPEPADTTPQAESGDQSVEAPFHATCPIHIVKKDEGHLMP